MSYLKKWLAVAFPGPEFTNQGDVLEHAVQTDYTYCGVYTANTIERVLFGTAILTEAECRNARIAWFKILMASAVARANTTTISVSTLINNFYLAHILVVRSNVCTNR
jgi:hypothetical protein